MSSCSVPTRTELLCSASAWPPRFTLAQTQMPRQRRGTVLVEVRAAGINPIDARRAHGYGSRLLRLKGAGRFPLRLGNDFAGVVIEPSGAWASGTPVFGLVPTGRDGGSHASHLRVPAGLVLRAPSGLSAERLATLPYTFTTAWLALHDAGLDPEQARGAEVLVNGASGGVGRLALQILRRWGVRAVAICHASRADLCQRLGAAEIVPRAPGVIATLPQRFDAVINFSTWADEPDLARRLRRGSLGHATTVHPLLGHLDAHGWIGGAVSAMRDHAEIETLVRSRSPRARYAWTIFRPERAALSVLELLLADGLEPLPVAHLETFDRAEAAFLRAASLAGERTVLSPIAPSAGGL